MKRKVFKECKIEGCSREVDSKGLCQMHYLRQRRGETNMSPEKLNAKGIKRPPWKLNDPRYKNKGRLCDVPGCKQAFYAKGLCRKHWNSQHSKGFLACSVIFKGICKVAGCQERETYSGYCQLHYSRYKRNIPLDRPKGVKGKLNYNWNGGVANYPNHYQMKKNRKVVLKKANYICHYCGKKATEVHHLDLSKDNHALSNLVATCHKCNSRIRKPHTSKFKRMYGGSLMELAEKLGVSRATIYGLHKKGKLNRMFFDEEIQSVLF